MIRLISYFLDLLKKKIERELKIYKMVQNPKISKSKCLKHNWMRLRAMVLIRQTKMTRLTRSKTYINLKISEAICLNSKLYFKINSLKTFQILKYLNKGIKMMICSSLKS